VTGQASVASDSLSGNHASNLKNQTDKLKGSDELKMKPEFCEDFFLFPAETRQWETVAGFKPDEI
jgi:hypothetical protein